MGGSAAKWIGSMLTPERLTALLGCLDDGVAFASPKWDLAWSNDAFREMASPSDVGVPQPLAAYFITREAFAAFRRDAEYLLQQAGGKRVCLEVALRSRSGGLLTALAAVVACPDDTEVAWIVTFRDLGEVDNLRQQLAERERSQSFLKGGTSDLVLRTNATSRITWHNDAARLWFQADDKLEAKLAPESWKELNRRLRDMEQSGREKEEVVLESAEGVSPAFLLRGYVRRLRNEDGSFAGISMIARDESDARRVTRLAETLGLSPREADILQYVASGYSNLNIAAILGLSESGVKFHVRNILGKAKVGTRTELMSLMLSM